MKYVDLDSNDFPVGFYDSKINNEIPTSAIKITDDQYIELIDNPRLKKINRTNNKVIDYIKQFDLLESQLIKKSEIKNAFNQAVKQGFTTTNGIKMDSDLADILRFDGGVRLTENMGLTSLNIRDFNNDVTNVVLTTAKNMVDELGANYQTLLNNKWTKNQEIDAATNQAEIDLVTF